MSSKVNKVLNHLARGIEDEGCYTSQDFKTFAREFKSMMNEQVAKVGGTNYQQNTGHYYVSGFFTVEEQPYYISISDVRYEDVDSILIRTAKDYRDFTGGRNNFRPIEDGMLDNIERVR